MNASGEPDLTSSPAAYSKDANVALILKSGGLWFVGGKFGITWKLMQGMVQPRATLRSAILNDGEKERMLSSAQDDEEEENEEENVVTVQDSDDENEEAANVQVEEEEEEERPSLNLQKKDCTT